MPEEVNRVIADSISDLLLCPTVRALENLKRENLAERAVLTGDVMLDAVLVSLPLAEQYAAYEVRARHPRSFALATVHRAENTGDPVRLRSILSALDHIARTVCPVLLPLHPRTKKIDGSLGWCPEAVSVLEPVSYFDMLMLESRARFILTDSGGMQKEAYFLKTPCITLRDETEWDETLENGCNVLTGANEEKIVAAAAISESAGPWGSHYGK
jgi:UDP-N-acetylglucosamine 2-epimerase